MAKKKRGKNNKNKWSAPKRSLVFKENMQEYVKMTKMLGDRRIMVLLPDNSERMAIIPGRFRKRCWMRTGDILLASFREFQDNKLDIIYKYTSEEARKLEGYDEIPSFFLSIGNADTKEEDEKSGISFGIEDDGFNFDDI